MSTNNTIEEVIKELKRLLNIESGSEVGTNHPLTQNFVAIDNYHKQGKLDLRNMLIGKIRLLVKHLKDIEKHDPSLLEHFRKKMLKVRDREYYGERLEINIASSLIRKNVKFTKSESPDFKKIDNLDIHIECSSAHLTQEIKDEKRLQGKLRKAILKKSKKGYARPNVALFLDITNIYYHDIKTGSEFTFKENLHKFVRKVLTKSKFGSVILFSYLLDPDKKQYFSNHVRIDNTKINDNLLNFLNSYFPLGNVHFEKHFFPAQG